MKELVNKILNQLSELPDFVGIALGEVNTKGNFGNTPLHVVAVQGDLEAAQLLLRAGADVNAVGTGVIRVTSKYLTKETEFQEGQSMARPLRIELSGGLYHLTSRGNERRAMAESGSGWPIGLIQG